MNDGINLLEKPSEGFRFETYVFIFIFVFPCHRLSKSVGKVFLMQKSKTNQF